MIGAGGIDREIGLLIFVETVFVERKLVEAEVIGARLLLQVTAHDAETIRGNLAEGCTIQVELVAGIVPVSIQREILGLVAERAVESHRFRRRVGDGQGNLDIEMLVDNLVDDFLEILLRLGIIFLNLLLGKSWGMLEGLQGIKLGFVFLVHLVPGLRRYGRLLIEGAVALVHHAPENLEQIAIRLDIGIGIIVNRFLVGIIV